MVVDVSGMLQVSLGYSRFGSYGEAEFSSGGCRSGSGEPGLFKPRDGPFGNHSNYCSNLPRNEPDPHRRYGGYDPYIRPNVESRNLTPGGDIGSYRGYSGCGVNSRPNFESSPVVAADAGSHRSYGVNDRYGMADFKSPSSFRQPNFERPTSSFSYSRPGMHMRESIMPLVDLQGPRVPPLEPYRPSSAPYGRYLVTWLACLILQLINLGFYCFKGSTIIATFFYFYFYSYLLMSVFNFHTKYVTHDTSMMYKISMRTYLGCGTQNDTGWSNLNAV